MRLLHTSDWHLGRSFHREDLLGAQGRFVDFLVETVRRERVDLVVVSGDVYDRALPGVDAVLLLNEALRRLVDTGARTVVISGNHDSASRLGFGAELIDSAGVHLRTDPARVGVPVPLEDAYGPVAVYGLPYLEPEAARGQLDCEARGHAAVLDAAMQRVRADSSRRPGTRSVVLAHAFVAGGAGSDSERDISVGGVSAVPTNVFAGVDYVALGHLHGAQALSPSVRYSGSPLAYSFSEAGHRKSVHLVELGARGVVAVESVPCPVPRPLAVLRGRLDDLLTDPGLCGSESAYVQVTLTDAERPRDPMERLRRRFPHVLVLTLEPEGGSPGEERSYAERVRGRSDLELALGFVEHVRRSPAAVAEVRLLQAAFEAARRAEAVR
ncbi:MAG: exonuclease SbcCD subunit D [Actinomycetota bacterium]|nr:exonuclease SbcCD subunit D [Actinomycetota bacterium]